MWFVFQCDGNFDLINTGTQSRSMDTIVNIASTIFYTSFLIGRFVFSPSQLNSKLFVFFVRSRIDLKYLGQSDMYWTATEF